jgi:hypothetical protein
MLKKEKIETAFLGLEKYDSTVTGTGGPRYMRSFYPRFCVSAIENKYFLRNLIYSHPWSFYM